VIISDLHFKVFLHEVMLKRDKRKPKHKLANLSLNPSQLLRLIQGEDVVEDGVRWDGLQFFRERPHVFVREVNLSSGLQAEVRKPVSSNLDESLTSCPFEGKNIAIFS